MGLTEIETKSSVQVMNLLHRGNKRRSQEATSANATSSRSHAVLQVLVSQQDKTPGTSTRIKLGKLSMIDLAGSERAANTQNRGKRLIEGANINRSLLALGNCINALGHESSSSSRTKAAKGPNKFVPYRDSKLTRLLKDALGGNCRTVMIAHVSMAKSSFEETLNTLKYANRAKNIKTTVSRNVLKVNYHISEYVSLIDGLKSEIQTLKGRAKVQPTSSRKNNNQCPEKEDSTFKAARAKVMKHFHERMNLQRRLIELENHQHVLEMDTPRVRRTESDVLAEDPTVNPTATNCQPHGGGRTDEELARHQRTMDANRSERQELKRKLLENARSSERLKHSTLDTLSSEERRELMQMEYRIGTLELDKMELVEAKIGQESLAKAKDLSIEKLEQELLIRDQIIQDQRQILVSNELDTLVNYGRNIVNSLEDATLSDGFESLTESITRMVTPPTDSYSFEEAEAEVLANPLDERISSDPIIQPLEDRKAGANLHPVPHSFEEAEKDTLGNPLDERIPALNTRLSSSNASQPLEDNRMPGLLANLSPATRDSNNTDERQESSNPQAAAECFPTLLDERRLKVPKPPPRRRMSATQPIRHLSEYAWKVHPVSASATVKGGTAASTSRRSTEGHNSRHRALPYIRVKKHPENTQKDMSPYLRTIKHRKKKRTSIPHSFNATASCYL